MSLAKTAEPIDMPYWLWTRVGHGTTRWGANWRHLANMTEMSICCGDAAFFVKIT